MKIEIENTDQVIEVVPEPDQSINGRLWVGKTEAGVAVQLLVLSIAVDQRETQKDFERELFTKPAPRPASMAFPLRLFL